MTDKVQKIREEVERLFNHVKDSNFESDSGAFYYLKDLLDFIDSLQEEPVSENLEEAASQYPSVIRTISPQWVGEINKAFEAGAKWQKVKTLSDMKKAVIGKKFQFSMDNVEAWGDDSNGKTIKLKGRVTFQVSNPESIIDALFAELENDN